jgi:hypothetical protein
MEEKNQKTQERQKYTNRLFYFSFEILGYFAVPAVVSVLVGKYLENNYEIDIIIPLLVGAYILSWIVFAARYRTLQKQRPDNKENNTTTE